MPWLYAAPLPNIDVVDRAFGRAACDGGLNLSGCSSTIGLESDEGVVDAFRRGPRRVSCWHKTRRVGLFLLSVRAIREVCSIVKVKQAV